MRRAADLVARTARREAEKLLEEFGVLSPEDIRLEDIAHALGIRVEDGGLSGSSARLTHVGGRAVMRVNADERHRGRRRFSIGHELGHFRLHRNGRLLNVCAEADMESWHSSERLERGANVFSANLLIPAAMMRRHPEWTSPRWPVVKEISATFEVSLTAAAIRAIELADIPCALVMSEDARIRWAATSEHFWPDLNQDGFVHRASQAAQVHRSRTLFDDVELVDADRWIHHDCALGEDAELYEHAISLGYGDRVLSLLRFEGLGEPDEVEDE